MPSFYNTPMQPTRPTVAAPPINEYREALYDEALPDDPAARMQEMKGRFDRLVRELGVSPRGPPPSGTSKFNTASSPRLPKVPSSKAWGSTPRRSKKKGAADFLPRRSGGAGVVLPPASGARRGSRGSSAASELRGPAEVVAFARLVGGRSLRAECVGAAARVVGGADGARAERVRQARAGDGAHGRLHRGADRRVSVAPPF